MSTTLRHSQAAFSEQMLGSVMSELRLLSSVEFDSKNILTVVLSGDARLYSSCFTNPSCCPLPPAFASDSVSIIRPLTNSPTSSAL